MENEKLLKAGFDIAYLCSCALHKKAPEKSRVETMDLKVVYRLACRHYLGSITYIALEAYNEKLNIDEETLKAWKEQKINTLRNSVLYELEREKIESFMEKAGIWYLPLKGIVLQRLYPQTAMRQMCDNDILFDSRYREELYEFMTKSGYDPYMYKNHSHDVYRKAPVFSFEMHVSLFNSTFTQGVEYYKDVEKRLVKAEGKEFGRKFTEEDFYIYIISHGARHINTGGIGIRSLIDIYLCIKNRTQSFNSEYVKAELTKLEIENFENQVRSLSQKLFNEENLNLNIRSILTPEEERILGFYYEAGVFGTMENYINNKVGNIDGKYTLKAKLKYLFSRTFPGMEYYKEHKPFLYKNKILIPFYVPVRIFKGIFKGKRTVKEIEYALKAKKK